MSDLTRDPWELLGIWACDVADDDYDEPPTGWVELTEDEEEDASILGATEIADCRWIVCWHNNGGIAARRGDDYRILREEDE